MSIRKIMDIVEKKSLLSESVAKPRPLASPVVKPIDPLQESYRQSLQEMTMSVAKIEGRTGAKLGLLFQDNPYTPRSTAHRDWKMGWMEYKDENVSKKVAEGVDDLEEGIGMDYKSRFLRALDAQHTKKAKGRQAFERAMDDASLKSGERDEISKEYGHLMMESPRTVPSSMLGNVKRWDADHVLDVADEVESRGGELSNADDAKAASDDLAFVGKVLPNTKKQAPIRGIKESEVSDLSPEDAKFYKQALKDAWLQDTRPDKQKEIAMAALRAHQGNAPVNEAITYGEAARARQYSRGHQDAERGNAFGHSDESMSFEDEADKRDAKRSYRRGWEICRSKSLKESSNPDA